ncbi:hypothetical protein GE061_010253 [Apolygus lucorum]|uniref:Uncharacterized protein n=1 Tax=Apolygus lucorum TaxID=248454 RepID=A0A8S9Y420_APOLU|nr:hypothetical protein GE061_010253 [Apolygus lucorum]
MYAFTECYRENPADADNDFKPDPVPPIDGEPDHSDSYKNYEPRRKRYGPNCFCYFACIAVMVGIAFMVSA